MDVGSTSNQLSNTGTLATHPQDINTDLSLYQGSIFAAQKPGIAYPAPFKLATITIAQSHPNLNQDRNANMVSQVDTASPASNQGSNGNSAPEPSSDRQDRPPAGGISKQRKVAPK
ncbi:hypothetical protein BBP40_009154 [Aspergillus hancockii]|nr:hypothetical protein BBP40_009154 [Aspergillus hancockii]